MAATKNKKKEKVKARNDHSDDVEDDYEELDQALKELKPKEAGISIKGLLMSPLGTILVLGSQLVTFIVLYLVFFDSPNVHFIYNLIENEQVKMIKRC